jgi:hypothetical protein
MPTLPTRLLTPAALAVAALAASAATALAAPLPEPEPVPVPQPAVEGVPAPAPEADGETRVAAPQVGNGESGTSSYEDTLHTVPNINGDPCTGAWESTVCYAMNFDDAPAVQPRSTVSSSP